MLLVLYRIVRKTPGHEEEPFDGFCKWAPALLADFAETDLWMADPKKLFSNLTEIKHMEHWSLGEPGLTDFQKKYLHFWDQLASWYEQLRKEILSRGKCWTGLAHRIVAENIQNNSRLDQWQHFVFAGFNALTTAQDKIFSALSSSGKAAILWDADRYYLEDPLNEAGNFMRLNREKYFSNKQQDFPHVSDDFAGKAKNITLIAAARNVSQARAAAGFLESYGAKFVPDETAVVLADEQLLFPMLNALPARFGDVNITMGYPLRNTPVYTLVSVLFSLQENAARLNVVSREGELKFYHHDVIRLLRHPYVVASSKDPAALISLIQVIGRKNMTFISPAQLKTYGGENLLHAGWFTPWKNGEHVIAQLNSTINFLRDVFSTRSENTLDTEFLYQFHLALNRISSLTRGESEFSVVSSIKNLLLQVFGSGTIPFSGEPLAGLQVMGLLETRCLDFKNVIVVSANEGVLPSQSSQHSFIMYDLRRAFGLPVYQDRDALSAYNFYRLLQRADNICLVYNTDQDTFGVKEKSRYVAQLIHELPKANPMVKFRSLIAGAELDAGTMGDAIAIPSSAEIVEIAKEKAKEGFSPSLINLFRECSLKFYFRYIAGLREQDEVEESVDQNTLGTIMHVALEKLYTPRLNIEQTPELLHQMKSEVVATCDRAFREIFPEEDNNGGKNLLARQIAQRYILQYLSLEISRIGSQNERSIKNTTVSLEEELETNLDVAGVPVRFKGKADRIDTMDRVVRLIDYKTGNIRQGELKISGTEEFLGGDKHGKAFQLMMYAWLYLKAKNASAIVQPAIISFRKLKSGPVPLELGNSNVLTSKTLTDFEEILIQITQQILSAETVFEQTKNQQQCRSCEFNTICRR